MRHDYTATYSPDDNKLRLYAGGRLPADVFARVKAAGFRWAPKQDLFVAPMWTPEREDLLVELCGEVGDEDTSLVDRAAERAERFEDYEANRRRDAEAAHHAVKAIADGIPLGQPILVGHHSERRARKDAERIENGMRRAVSMWRTADYWRGRAAGALRHAKYKERPDVRARRIKTLEAELRKMQRNQERTEGESRQWRKVLDLAERQAAGVVTAEAVQKAAIYVANYSHGYDCWRKLTDGAITPADAARESLTRADAYLAHVIRWIEHYENRIAYERAMLDDQGGTVAERTGPEKGGGVRCWASPGYGRGWSYIQKVNRVSVTVLDDWGNGGRCFTRTIPFDKLAAVMTRAEVEAGKAQGLIRDVCASDNQTVIGFYRLDPDATPEPPKAPEPEPAPEKRDGAAFEAMAETLRAGVQVVAAPQLFPTPAHVAAQVVALADIDGAATVLEPSAGTGRLLDALAHRADELRYAHGDHPLEVVAVEVRPTLCQVLEAKYRAEFVQVVCADFLEWAATPGRPTFDRIVMNPPFENGADIKHIEAARKLLAPGGRLVAICAGGPRQERAFPDEWQSRVELPSGTFEGTDVRAVILVFDGPAVACEHCGAMQDCRADVFHPGDDCGVSGCFHDTQAEAEACAASRTWDPQTGRLPLFDGGGAL